MEAVGVARQVRAYPWARWGRFAWMRYIALIVGVLIALVVPYYMLLVILYPALRSTPMTSAALAIILALAVLAVAGLALVALLVVALLLWLPFALVHSRLRERQRRTYRYPAR
ncbi:MAG TPA: hypothetical protein VFN78_02160 [Ktedonobacterales bacterium]|nr:hypothetical protein [Ktedonobacterales bacterium]